MQADLRSLLNRIRSGDADAFAALYDSLAKPVYTIAFRITGSREHAEDITQEIFLRIWRKPPDDTVKNPRAWIFQMTHHLAVDTVRRIQPEPLDETHPAPESDLTLAAALHDALCRLTAEEREVVLLHTDAGLAFHEIAAAMHCSLPSAYRCWRRALKKLRAALEEGEES